MQYRVNIHSYINFKEFCWSVPNILSIQKSRIRLLVYKKERNFVLTKYFSLWITFLVIFSNNSILATKISRMDIKRVLFLCQIEDAKERFLYCLDSWSYFSKIKIINPSIESLFLIDKWRSLIIDNSRVRPRIKCILKDSLLIILDEKLTP